MAQRTQPPQPSGTGRPTAGRTSGPRGRKPAPVKKPFPVALVLGSVALAAVLIGVIVFAVINQGSGAKGTLAQVDKLSGLDADGEPCYLMVGGLEVATTPERSTSSRPIRVTCTSWQSRV